MSSRVVHALNTPYRLIPDGLAFRSTAPIIRWVCRRSAEDSEYVEYDGQGTVTYVGDDGERQIGRNEALLSMIPGMVWFSILFLFATSTPVGVVSALISLILCVMVLVSLSILGEIEINAVDEVHHL